MIEIYDLECLQNIFTYTGINKDSDDKSVFLIHESRNELKQLVKHLKENVTGHIGYNNLNYDYPLLHYILTNYKTFAKMDTLTLVQVLFDKSTSIINAEYSSIRPMNVKIPQLDLFRIWHFDNKARSTSLKQIQMAINYHNVEDMPIGIHDEITEEDIDKVLRYNLNDVLSTKEFYKITKGITELPLYKDTDKIALRKDIMKHYNIPCLNYNDVKIGVEIGKKIYCDISGRNWWDFKNDRTPRPEIHLSDCISKHVSFKTTQLQLLLQDLNHTVITDTKGSINMKFEYGGNTFKMGTGGLHTVDKPRKIVPNENQKLCEVDVSSFYPRIVLGERLYPEHLGEEWLQGYRKTFEIRLDAKGKKGISPKYALIADTYKLSLNGSFGKMNEPNSWLYDPLPFISITVTGQLSLLILIEDYVENGIKVLSANTDGIVCLVEKEQEELFQSINKDWEERTDYVLEETVYKMLIMSSVNDYLAVKANGKIKYKGSWEINKEIHKNHSKRIVPVALKEYFINGIPVEDTIDKCNDIFEFLIHSKMTRVNKLVERTFNGLKFVDKALHRHNRYYVSKKGVELIKILPPLEDKKDKLEKYREANPQQIDMFKIIEDVKIDKNRETNLEVGWKCTVLNKYIKKPIEEYGIDKNYYINECYKILKPIEQ